MPPPSPPTSQHGNTEEAAASNSTSQKTLYFIGDRIPINDLNVIVWSAERRYAHIIINVQVVNNGKNPIRPPAISLVDHEERRFTRKSDLATSKFYLEKINPGIAKQVELQFEVPDDGHYYAVISRGWPEQSARVRLRFDP